METNIHYPTGSALLGDGVRVLTRIMKKVAKASWAVGTKLRDRTRAVKLKVLAIARASRNKTWNPPPSNPSLLLLSSNSPRY